MKKLSNEAEEPIVYDWNELKNLSSEEIASLKEISTTGSDIDGVLCTYNVQKKNYRPNKLHEYFSLAIPTKRSSIPVDVLITGRKKCYWKTTMNWAEKHEIKYKVLIMFPTGEDKNKATFDRYKSEIVNLLELDTYFEDDHRTVEVLKENCPNTDIIEIEVPNRIDEETKSEVGNPSSLLHSFISNIKDRQLKKISIDKISPDAKQHRTSIDEEKLDTLAASIKSVGLLEPIEIRPDPSKPDHFIIIFGHYRFMAMEKLGQQEIECFVVDITDETLATLRSLTENIHRSNLSSVEREKGIFDLWNSHYFKTQKELAEALGYTESSISQLVNAHEMRIGEKIVDEISTKIIVKTSSLYPKTRKEIYNRISNGTLSNKAVEELVNQAKQLKDEQVQELYAKTNFPKKAIPDFIKAANNEPKIGIKNLEYLINKEKSYQNTNNKYTYEFITPFIDGNFHWPDTLYEPGRTEDIIIPEDANELKNVVDASQLNRTVLITVKPEDYPIFEKILELFEQDISKAFLPLCKFYLEHHKSKDNDGGDS